ncbi:hypothetical protein [Pseudonocardia alaniniphila]|nr:hypothetical protein [Pseudonocardia alaniniphila]
MTVIENFGVLDLDTCQAGAGYVLGVALSTPPAEPHANHYSNF